MGTCAVFHTNNEPLNGTKNTASRFSEYALRWFTYIDWNVMVNYITFNGVNHPHLHFCSPFHHGFEGKGCESMLGLGWRRWRSQRCHTKSIRIDEICRTFPFFSIVYREMFLALSRSIIKSVFQIMLRYRLSDIWVQLLHPKWFPIRRKLLQASIRANKTGHFIWIGSDSWGAKSHPVRDQELAAVNAITVLPKRTNLQGERNGGAMPE